MVWMPLLASIEAMSVLMPTVIRCPHCQKQMKLAEEAAGRPFRCPFCKKLFQAPQPVAVAAPDRQPLSTAKRAMQSSTPVAVTSPPPLPATVKPPSKNGGLSKPRSFSCPVCGATVPLGAEGCMECGRMMGDPTQAPEEPPNLCSNPACGVVNPTSERYCQRCSCPLPSPSGTLLHGRYRIKKLLAMGGFGAVYLAEDQKTGSEVAVKDMICADPKEFSIRLNFFRREAHILRNLNGFACVARFHDLIEDNRSAHLIMEYIPGRNLQEILDANDSRPFPLSHVIEWGKGICDVLTHMHGLSPPVIHRDLKPENIMLRPDGRSIALIDFGTARDLGRHGRDNQHAKTRVYTEGYAPPEQIVGKPEPRSDLFSLAGTLYQLITGKAPEGYYTGKELEQRLAQANGIPQENRWFFELLRINLAEDIHDRYHSAREIKADLEKGQLTRERPCSACGTANPVREPFCHRCAAPLTDLTPPCHQCGKGNRMGSRFCIHCGNRMR